MNPFDRQLVAIALCLIAAPAISADFDGSKPLICSAIEAHDCAAGMTCEKGRAEDINVPQFIRIDFAAKTISARGRTSPLNTPARGNGLMVIQGFENTRAFSITVSEQTGKLVGAIAGDEEGFMVFGACTPL